MTNRIIMPIGILIVVTVFLFKGFHWAAAVGIVFCWVALMLPIFRATRGVTQCLAASNRNPAAVPVNTRAVDLAAVDTDEEEGRPITFDMSQPPDMWDIRYEYDVRRID